MEKNSETVGFSIAAGADEGSGPQELAYLNLVKLPPATLVGNRYRLVKLIGQGGFGIVFEALDETLNSRVALKFLNPRLTKNEKKFLRVKREINLSRRISDTRIIKVFSLETWQGIYFLVMELAAGKSLKSLLREKGRYSWAEFREIFLQILEAVQVLHQNGIVHRDLKPANILVEDKLGIKILDFGLAKELVDTDRTSTVGEVVGSPYYMSPEQIRGEAIDCRSDVYQLGLILYRALSGRHPFEHTSTMEVIFRQLNRSPERLETIGGTPPRFLRFGLEKALEKSRKRRFRDAGAMVHFFRKERLTRLSRLLRSLGRRRFKWALAGITLASLLALGYFTTFGARALHSLNNAGGMLEARNRFGVRLWQKDFAPFSVYYAYPTRSSVPAVMGTGSPSSDLRLRLGDRKVIMVILTPPSYVFPASASISSSALFSERVILGERGETLRREPFLWDYEYDTYDYVKAVKPHLVRLLPGEPGKEAEALVTVQQYQSMYPCAMVYLRGIKKYVFTHPGTFEVTPLPIAGSKASFMLYGINNLFSHMSFLAEIGFDTAGDDDRLIKGIPNFFPDERNNIPYEDKLYVLPARARMIENRWRENGRARFSEDIHGDIMEVNRAGRIALHTRNGTVIYQDAPDVLRRVYTLVNAAFQEKMKKRSLEGALAMIAQAASFPLQNPFLHSGLLNMQGDLEIGLGRYAEGEKTLLRSLELYAGNNDSSERLCEMEVLRGDPQAALKRLAGRLADGSEFWGFSSFGVSLFKGYVFLHTGMFSKADDEFFKIGLNLPDMAQYCQAMGSLFRGNYAAALAAMRDLEKRPLAAVDLRELRLLLARALLLDLSDNRRARFLFDDILRNSLEFGHLAELSTWNLLAREDRAAEARRNSREVFARLQKEARGDFMTRLWLFYDAYVFARTMEMADDMAEAARGYRACIAANPHTELAARSRRRLALLNKKR